MSIDATNWAWSLQDLSSSEKLVLLSFADRAGDSNEAWPSWMRLTRDTCLDRKTIHKVLVSLQKKGLILKTGEKKKQVFVYRLIGVTNRHENLSTTSPKNGTSSKNGTSTKNGTQGSPKNGTTTSPKNGTQNHQLNRHKKPKAQRAADSIFLPIKDLIHDIAAKTDTMLTDDLSQQVQFYAEKSEDKQEHEQSVKIALSLIRNKRWKIPSGYKGITSKSIAAKDEAYQHNKMIQANEDAKIMRSVKYKIMEQELKNMKQGLL